MNREIDEELESHIQEAIQNGRDPAEVRRAFGSTLRHREESRDVRLLTWLDSLRTDAVFGLRQLKKNKITSGAAILSLALAIGACTSVFRLIDALLVRPLPVVEPEGLYILSRHGAGFDGKPGTFEDYQYPLFRQLRDAVKDQAKLLAISYEERIVSFVNPEDHSLQTTDYRLTADGVWHVAGQTKGSPEFGPGDLKVTVEQGLNKPPLLVANNKQASRAIWNPNPQLKSLEMDEGSVYRWKDKEGRSWRGGLFKPAGYNPGQHYPLVIQTHGFYEAEFRPSGFFPTAFAARALAAAGIVVLQVSDEPVCLTVTPTKGLVLSLGMKLQ